MVLPAVRRPFQSASPSPLALPGAGPAPLPGAASLSPLMGGLDALLKPPLTPIYPSGYTRPPKPSPDLVSTRAENARKSADAWLEQMASIYRWLRYHQQGAFTEDIERREMGEQEAWVSNRLVELWNAISAYLADQEIAFTKRSRDPENTVYAQMVEDFAYYLRQEEEWAHAEQMNMNLQVEEAKYLTATGMVASRDVLDLRNTDCPFNSQLIDPCSIFFGGTDKHGPTSVYVINRMNIHTVLATYTTDGDLPRRVLKEIKPLLDEFGENAEVDVIEYWDTWYRSVTIGEGIEIMPVTEHKYGIVPFTVQYGPGGEPMGSRSPDMSRYRYSDNPFAGGGRGVEQERLHKAVSFIHYMIADHIKREAVGAKVQEEFLKDLNPPRKIKTTNVAEDGDEPIDVDDTPGGRTNLLAGEEDVELLDRTPAGFNAQALMQLLEQDGAGSDMLKALTGTMPGSNISGVAQSMSMSSAEALIAGWRKSLESFYARKTSRKAYLWRNFGHESRYLSGSKKPFFVPNRYPSMGESPSHEITPEILDKVGGKVECRLWKFKPQEMLAVANVGQMLMQSGIWGRDELAERMNQFDFQRRKYAIQADELMVKAQQLPEYMKAIAIPDAFDYAIAEAAGNPELQMQIMAKKMYWLQYIAEPQKQQMSGQAQGMDGPPQGGPPNLPPGPGAGPGSNQVSRPMIGNQVPGSVSGQQGGPAGPVGPRVPAPPGSIRLVE